MIRIPKPVQKLFKEDSIRKNFRVTFPNGEFRDLVNSDIVSESVVFTESVSSGDTLKFGLAEGNNIQFQTYFNQNIRNLKIYAEIEIDVSSIVGTTIRDTYKLSLGDDFKGAFILRDSIDYVTVKTDEDLYVKFIGVRSDGETDTLISMYHGISEEATYTLADNPLQSANPSTEYTAITISFAGYDDPERPVIISIQVTWEYLFSYQTSDDVEYPYYAVPYGYFYVDSCKKDGTSGIRSVIAYQNKYDVYGDSADFTISNDEMLKLKTLLYFKTQQSSVPDYTINATRFLCSCLGSYSFLGDAINKAQVDLRFHNYTTQPTPIFAASSSYPFVGYDYEFKLDYKTIWCRSATYEPPGYYSEDITELDYLYELQYYSTDDINSMMRQLIINFVHAADDSQYIDPSLPDDDIVVKFFEKLPLSLIRKGVTLEDWYAVAYPTLYFTGVVESTTRYGIFKDKLKNKDNTRSFVFYPYISEWYDKAMDDSGWKGTMEIRVCTGITIQKVTVGGQYTTIITMPFTQSDYKLYAITTNPNDADIVRSLDIKFPRDIKYGRVGYNNYWTYATQWLNVSFTGHWRNYSYNREEAEALMNVRELLNSMIELYGAFLKVDRESDSYKAVTLNYNENALYPSPDLYPLPSIPKEDALYPSGPQHHIAKLLWSKVWYDDKFTNGYDRVYCKWINEDGNETEFQIAIINKDTVGYYAHEYQAYDISDNYFIKTQGLLTEEQVEEILEKLASIVGSVQYYPATIEMRALPYMEAGDEVVVATDDGGFPTFCLRHRISGIHALMDNIESR